MDPQQPTQHLCSFILILIYFFPLISVIFFFFLKEANVFLDCGSVIVSCGLCKPNFEQGCRKVLYLKQSMKGGLSFSKI